MGCKPETWKEGEGGGKRNGKRAHSVSSCLVLDSVSCFPWKSRGLACIVFFHAHKSVSEEDFFEWLNVKPENTLHR